MAILDTSVILCGLAFPKSDSGILLQGVIDNKLIGTISNKIIYELEQISKLKAPWLVQSVKEFVENYCRIIALNQDDIDAVAVHTSDKGDNHVIAAAKASKERIIYTLDIGFFSNKMKEVTKAYGIEAQFPSNELFGKTPIEHVIDYSAYYKKTKHISGALTLTLGCTWDSMERKSINKKWYVLDDENVFSLWYDTLRQSFIFMPHAIGKDGRKEIRMHFIRNEKIRVTIVFDQEEGFDIYINDEMRQCKKEWRSIKKIPDFNIGHDCHCDNHFNGYFAGMRLFKGYIPPRTVKKMHSYNILSMSDKDLEIADKHRWILSRFIL